jgi:DNA-binding HxlR family transcriptional regulator
MTGPSGGQRTRPEQPGQAVLALIRQPYVAEILATLDERPHDLDGLLRATGAPRRRTVAALHALAAHQAITREPERGTWDGIDQERARYCLTATGSALIGHLLSVDSRWAAYAMYLPFFE